MDYKVAFFSYGVEVDNSMYHINDYDTFAKCLYDIYSDFPNMDYKLFIVISEHLKEIMQES